MPGSTLLLYTDGLIERRDRDLDDGMARAAAVLAEGRDLAPADLADVLTEKLLADAPMTTSPSSSTAREPEPAGQGSKR